MESEENAMTKRFFQFVLPSMLAFAFSGVYAIVDGLFVGRNVGDIGLAGINIAYPLTALIPALGTGIGMGGSVYYSIEYGKGNKEKAKEYVGNTFSSLLIGGILLMIFLVVTYEPILKIFGASGELLVMAEDYIEFIILGTVFQVLSTGLIPILRNYGAVLPVMLFMICGFMTNIVLDYLLVVEYQYGVAGAGLATIAGQALTMVLCFILFMKKEHRLSLHHYKLRMSYLKSIVSVGISPFGLTLSPNIVIIFMNWKALEFGGDIAVSVYAVISYIIYAVQLLLQGVGDGSQPLISLFIGEKNIEGVKKIRHLAYGTAVFMAVLGFISIYLLRYHIPIVFGTSDKVTRLTAHAFPVFAIGLIFTAYLRITTSYFYATRKNLFSYILVYGEPIVLFLLLLLVPEFLKLGGVWISSPLSQLVLTIVAVILYTKEKKKAVWII